MSTRLLNLSIRAALIVSMLFIYSPAVKPVSAVTTFTVNSYFDTPDQTVGDGICNDGGGNCTLRAAIMEANATSGAVTISFTADYGIDIYSALPALNNPDGITIRAGMRLVSINGTNAGPAVDGLVLSSNNNRIQGLTIYNFSGNGIRISRDYNIIGMDSDGSNDAQEFNQIHSNSGNGIYVSSGHNRISGNFIGQTVLGTSKPNLANGIEVAGFNTLIGVITDGVSDNIEGNTIAYNAQDGIFDHGSSSVIAGNKVINNQQNGIFISLSGSVRVGTDGNGESDTFEGNRISGNMNNGIYAFDSDNLIIAGNKIGVNELGTGQHRNYDYGIYLNLSNFAVIGTDGDGLGATNEGNLISGNTDGQIYALNTYFTTISGNKIGTDITGTSSISASQGFGIKLVGGNLGLSNSIIGTNSDGDGDGFEGNLISGLGWYGIQISDSEGNTIRGNIIGLNTTGQVALANDGNGVELVAASSANRILNNTISGNDENGVFFSGALNNRVRGNRIGTNVDGTTSVGNQLNGILISGSQGSERNIIGTDSGGSITSSDSNIISGNLQSGIKIEGSTVQIGPNGIYGNKIGTTADGAGALPNFLYGVHLMGPFVNFNYIQDNLIANNNYAVKLDGTADTYGNTIARNSMINNLGGISIQDTAANDNKDLDDGPNGKQNYPVLTLAERTGNILGVNFGLNSTPSMTFFIHFYLTRSCHESQNDANQGEAYIGTGTTTTNNNGLVTGGISFDLPSDYQGKGTYLLATATNPEGSTSEFSNCIKVDGLYNWLFLPLIQR